MVTTVEDIKKLKDGIVIELPDFDKDTPFTARVKRPSLMEMCSKGTIPNPLLNAAQRLWEGDIPKGRLKDYNEVIRKVVEVALVEPTYADVKDVLTDDQLIAIFDYTQGGAVKLLPFREQKRQIEYDRIADEVLQKIISRSNKDREKSSKTDRDKK